MIKILATFSYTKVMIENSCFLPQCSVFRSWLLWVCANMLQKHQDANQHQPTIEFTNAFCALYALTLPVSCMEWLLLFLKSFYNFWREIALNYNSMKKISGVAMTDEYFLLCTISTINIVKYSEAAIYLQINREIIF